MSKVHAHIIPPWLQTPIYKASHMLVAAADLLPAKPRTRLFACPCWGTHKSRHVSFAEPIHVLTDDDSDLRDDDDEGTCIVICCNGFIREEEEEKKFGVSTMQTRRHC